MIKAEKQIGLELYLSNPVPILSDTNVKFISGKIEEGKYDYFVEYGLGSSTLYFVNKYIDYSMRIISIENSIDWFRIIVDWIKKIFKTRERKEKYTYFSLSEIYKFIKDLDKNNPEVPEELSRRKKWKENILLGPFCRLAPHSNTKFSGIIPFWPVSRYFFFILGFIIYLIFYKMRPTRGEFNCMINDLNITFRNVPPAIKDQYAEAPSREEYIYAGLKSIQKELEASDKKMKAAFLIDGGPRGEIVKRILNLEDKFNNFYPSIFLCDAHRGFYAPVLAKRPTGKFLPGSNVTLKGEILYNDDPDLFDEKIMHYLYGKNNVTKNDLIEKELWFYQKKE